MACCISMACLCVRVRLNPTYSIASLDAINARGGGAAFSSACVIIGHYTLRRREIEKAFFYLIESLYEVLVYLYHCIEDKLKCQL